MTTATAIAGSGIDWGVASLPKPGQAACGDLHLVKTMEDMVLLAVVDGLGHGSGAVTAAQSAVEILEQHATEPLITLVHRCHQALACTQGVVMTLASVQLSDGTMTWIGVGNVQGWLFRAGNTARPSSEPVLLRSGVVGFHLPALYAGVLTLGQGDTLVFATDGIRADFTEHLKPAQRPADMAQHILAHNFKGTDDALVLAVRYLGRSHV